MNNVDIAVAVEYGPVRFAALDLQHAPLKERLHEAFERLLDSSAFTLGAEVEEFEREFAAYCGVDHCIGVSSGTAALTLMLRAYGIGPGDEVIVPAHTFIASALAAAHVGATPVLCDVLDDTGLIDPDAARAAVGPRTAAIIAVHLYGQACDMDAVNAFARPAGLLVLEDAAQAAGARYSGRPVGSLGAAAGFSFYPGKNLGALGDGGAVCTNDALLASRLRRLRNLGQRTKGEHVEIGYNERLDGLQAACCASSSSTSMAGMRLGRSVPPSIGSNWPVGRGSLRSGRRSPCIYHLFPARFEDRDRVAAVLHAADIETGSHYPMPFTSTRRGPVRSPRYGDLPVAEAWAAEELSLPMHPDLKATEIERVAEAIETAQATRG